MWKKLFGNERDPQEIQHIPEDIGHSTTEVPHIQAEIRLENDEFCCLEVSAVWARRQKSRRTYKGGGLSVRVGRGVYLRAGVGQSDPSESVENISAGRLFVTTKRFVFHGHSKSITLSLGDIANILHGPDHLQLIFEGAPTELFIIDQKLLNHEKVRQLISRVWLVARDGGFIGLDQRSLPDEKGAQGRLEQLREDIEKLSAEIEENFDTIDADLAKFSRIVNNMLEIESCKKSGFPDQRYRAHVPRRQLIYRILDGKNSGETSSAEADRQFERIREIEKPIFPILTDVQIFNEQRMSQWLQNSTFDGQTGLAGQAYQFAFDRQIAWDPIDDDGHDAFDVNWDRQARTQKMGHTMITMFHDCEALTHRSGIVDILDEDFFAYVAAIAAAENICVERFGTEVWEEVNESVDLAAGSERLDLIHRFIADFSAEVNEAVEASYLNMESSFDEGIRELLVESNDANSFYRNAIHAAEEFWVALISASQAEDVSKPTTHRLGDSDIEQRLARLKSLFDKGAVSELEYQRQRQRILGEV